MLKLEGITRQEKSFLVRIMVHQLALAVLVEAILNHIPVCNEEVLPELNLKTEVKNLIQDKGR